MADWSATNQLVMSWLLNAIFPKISTSLILKTSAKQVWSRGARILKLKAIPDRFPFVSAKMDEKKDKNWFTRLDYSHDRESSSSN